MATCYVTDPRTRMGRTRQDLRALLIAPATATLCPANIVVCDMGIRTFLRAAVRTSSILAPPLARRLFPDAYAPGGRSGPLRRDPSIASHTSGAIAARRANVLHRYLQPWFGWTLGLPPPKNRAPIRLTTRRPSCGARFRPNLRAHSPGLVLGTPRSASSASQWRCRNDSSPASHPMPGKVMRFQSLGPACWRSEP